MRDIFVYDAIRTPRGRARDDGGLHALTPHEMLNPLYHALPKRTGLDPGCVGEVVLGCVTQYGEQAGNIAQSSPRFADWPEQLGGMTVNRFCSSSIDAINIAGLKIAAGQEQLVVAGGIEMMSRVPMLADRASVFSDHALAMRCQILMMGNGADLIASLYNIDREQADAVAVQSQQRAQQAQQQGHFSSIIPVFNEHTDKLVMADECIRADVSIDSLGRLPAVFANTQVDAIQLAAYPHLEEIRHIHSAGNSPAMADGAALLLLGDESAAALLDRPPLARIRGAATANGEPLQVLSGCVAATRKLMAQHGLWSEDIDLFEIHEAFAATVLMVQQELGIPADKLNVNGGVIALGHPMGATGAIMAGTLLDELVRRKQKTGIVAASGAAGAGSALLLEML